MDCLNSKSSLKTMDWQRVVLIFSINVLFVYQVTSVPLDCSPSLQTFELVTGFVFTGPDDTLSLVPSTLHLEECLSYCRQNTTCRAVNFETGLCVLFSSSAIERPEALTSSEYPVFTIYAQKICLGELACNREWIFERVSKFELLGRSRKIAKNVPTREKCMELCLKEREFECRSANFHRHRNECQMSDFDRHSVLNNLQKHFVAAEDGTEYIENNCVDPSVRLCEFQKLNGKILKTVDAVFQDVTTVDECRKKCLSVNYRCQSFDLGDPMNSVCRLSHLSSPSLANIKEPYLEVHGASTYEISSCYNVTIDCRSREMVAFVRTTRLFNGKVYVKSRPNSCVTDVLNSMDFEIRMAYHDLNCDVKQQGNDEFANDIVIQHHDQIVTNQDLGVTVHCQYDLANRSITNEISLEVQNDVSAFSSHAVSVAAPNISMKITDRLGRNLFKAEVGDSLLLRFQITDKDSPYEMFVRELIAMDGIDNSEILLIDALGCPTDPLILGPISKAKDGKSLQTNFDAFKFPTSEIVQFKALVTPCLPTCEPADCSIHIADGMSHSVTSFGKKRRKRWLQRKKRDTKQEDEVVVIQTIHITDKFGFDSQGGKKSSRHKTKGVIEEYSSFDSPCESIVIFVISGFLFLFLQLMLVLVHYRHCWKNCRRKKQPAIQIETSRSIDMICNNRSDSSLGNLNFGIDNPYRHYPESGIYDNVYVSSQGPNAPRRY